jgi:hypothetical protein
MTTDKTIEKTIKPEEILAIKLGFKHKNGKADITTFIKTLVNIVLLNSDSITNIEQIDKAIKLYSNNGIAKRNLGKSLETIEKIENAINECIENNKEPTKTLLNKRYGINYNALKTYQELNPDKLPK